CSISSPKSSTRSGSRPVGGETSTNPPPTPNRPRPSSPPPGCRPPPGGSPLGDPQRLGPLVAPRDRLRGRRCRRTDQPAGREHVEGARPLTAEVRRRWGATPPADAAAREVCDLLVPEEPRGRLGEVARVRVLGEQHDEPAPDLLVEPPRDDWQRGPRQTRPRRQPLGELAQPVGLRPLANERMEDRQLE